MDLDRVLLVSRDTAKVAAAGKSALVEGRRQSVPLQKDLARYATRIEPSLDGLAKALDGLRSTHVHQLDDLFHRLDAFCRLRMHIAADLVEAKCCEIE